MVEIIKDFYMMSNKTTYKIGQKVEFEKDKEKRLASKGLVLEIKQPKKTKSNK